MDVFDPFHICNHDDAEGRYAYKVKSPPRPSFPLTPLTPPAAPAHSHVSVSHHVLRPC